MAWADINPSLSSSVLTDGNLMARLYFMAWILYALGSANLVLNVTVMTPSHPLPLKRKKKKCLHVCFGIMYITLPFSMNLFILGFVGVTKSQMHLSNKN